jgi:ribonucleoside-diphosphate reductase alpha chain
VDILANHQSSKGGRRHRIQIEESALLNNVLFEDVLEPIVNTPRRTIGKIACVAPEELNGQINFLSTPGFKGSDEYHRSIRMIKEMGQLSGKMVLGSEQNMLPYAVMYSKKFGEPANAGCIIND